MFEKINITAPLCAIRAISEKSARSQGKKRSLNCLGQQGSQVNGKSRAFGFKNDLLRNGSHDCDIKVDFNGLHFRIEIIYLFLLNRRKVSN